MADEQVPDPTPEGNPRKIVARFTGDGSEFQSGIPNRDITVADGLTNEQIELAVESGTHKRT